MKRIIIVFCVFLFTIFNANVVNKIHASYQYGWTRTGGGVTDDYGVEIETDHSGNIFVVGRFTGTNVDFNKEGVADLHSSTGSSDAFITKINADGTYGWTRTFGGTAFDSAEGVAVDQDGNIFVVGYFTGSVDFDPNGAHDVQSSGSIYSEVYVMKIDSNNTYEWTKVITASSSNSADTYGSAIAVDSSGNIFVGGRFAENNTDFDPSGATDLKSPVGGYDIFVTKLTSSGTYTWTKTVGGTNDDALRGIKSDSSGNVYFSGEFRGTNVDFDFTGGTYNLSSNGGSIDGFLSKVNADGSFGWALQIPGSAADTAWQIDCDSNNNVIVAGYFTGTDIDFDPSGTSDLHSSNGDSDAYLAKYTENGTLVFARTVGGNSYDYGYGAGFDSSGKAYLSGSFNGTVDFDPSSAQDQQSTTSDVAVFVSMYDASGNYLQTETVGGTHAYDWSESFSLALDNDNNLIFTGIFTDNAGGGVDFDPFDGTDLHDNADNSGNYDFFFTKLAFLAPSPSPSATSASQTGTNSSSSSTPSIYYPPAPYSYPVIYQIKTTAESVTLIFFPGAGEVTNYGVFYGLNESTDNYSAYPIGTSGTREFVIGKLMSNTTYYFRLVPYHGLTAGPGSPVVKATTVSPGSAEVTKEISLPEISPLPSPIPLPSVPKQESDNSSQDNLPVKVINGKTLGIATTIGEISAKAVSISVEPLVISLTSLAGLGFMTGVITLFSSLIEIYFESSRKLYLVLWDLLIGVFKWIAIFFSTLLHAIFGWLPKKKNQGIVFETRSNTPIAGAYVIMYSPSGNLTTSFSNTRGEYKLVPKPDKYLIKVTKTGFSYPSQLIQSIADKYNNLYQMEEVIVDHEGDMITKYALPMDGKVEMLQTLFAKLERLLVIPAAVTWSLLTIFAALYSPTNYYLIVCLVSLIISAGQIRRLKWAKKISTAEK